MAGGDGGQGITAEIGDPAARREERYVRDLTFLARLQQADVVTLACVIVVLHRRHRCDPARLGQVRRVVVAEPEVSDESLVAQLSEGLELRRNRRAVWRLHRSHAQVHQVEAIQTERLLCRLPFDRAGWVAEILDDFVEHDGVGVLAGNVGLCVADDEGCRLVLFRLGLFDGGTRLSTPTYGRPARCRRRSAAATSGRCR
jgi:hypothetical protein